MTSAELTLSARRIYALIYRSLMLMWASPPRLIEAIYWPTLNMLLMGFMNSYLFRVLGLGEMSFHLILGATILLEFFLRAGVSMLLVFVEEIYARNVGQLYASPLRAYEQILAYVIIMVLRLIIGLLPAILLCALLFGYNIFALGPWFLLFAFILVGSGLAWGIMLICLLLRFGQGAEWFGWMLGWFFVPFIGVYYPLSVLPDPMRWLGEILPPSAVFEALRQISSGQTPPLSAFVPAILLMFLYIVLASLVLRFTLKSARIRGSLLNLNE
jgi:ABC-2 type transport system permease protein